MSLYKTYILISFVAVCLLLSPLSAYAALPRIAGSATLGYRDYDIKGGASKDDAGESFYQKYSLIAMQRGNLYNRRGGPYQLNITYDHLQYLTDINGTDYSPSTSFLGWNGGLALKMPHLYGLNLTLYSSKSRTVSQIEESFSGDLSSGLVYDLLLNDIKNSGFSMSLGTNGGPYYYLYQNSYEQLRDEINDEKFTRRAMAVQYGVNWLHLYEDKEDPGDRKILTFILGNKGLRNSSARTIPERLDYFSGVLSSAPTVSNYLARSSPADIRLWYKLTNWLDVSADILYSEEENDYVEDISTKKLTLALKGSDGQTDMGTYSVHERIDTDSKSSRLLHLPLWIDHSISPGTNIYFSNNYDSFQTKDLTTLVVDKSRKITEALTLISRPRNNVFMETEYKFTRHDNNDAGRESHSLNLRGYARQNKSLNYSFLYRYGINVDYHAVDDAVAGTYYSGTASYSHNLEVSVAYRPTPQARFYLRQGYLSGYERKTLPSERYERFNTSFNFDWKGSNGFKSYLDITRSTLVYEDGTEEVDDSIVADMAKNLNGRMRATIDVSLTKRRRTNGINDESTNSYIRGEINYKVEKNLLSNTRLTLNSTDTNQGSTQSRLEIGEELRYNYYRDGFTRRKLFDLTGSVWYSKLERDGSNYNQWLKMQVNYYPSATFHCGVAYSTENEDYRKDEDSSLKTLYFALTYPLLSLNGSYSQQLDGVGDEEENMFKLDLRKKF